MAQVLSYKFGTVTTSQVIRLEFTVEQNEHFPCSRAAVTYSYG